jgi:hypothetical protein
MASRQKDPGIANRSVAAPVSGQLPLANFTQAAIADAVLTSSTGTPVWDNTPQIQTYYFSGRIAPADISANKNDYLPIDGVTSQSFHEVMQISVSATGTFNITGFDEGTTGEPKVFTNRGTNTITLKHNDSNSSVNNRIWCPNATDFAVQGKTSVQLYYSQPDNKWVVVGGTQSSGAGTNALLDGSVHSDTVAQTVSRGSIVYGNSTPKWDELTVGASGTVLSSDGTDVSWQTVPSSGTGGAVVLIEGSITDAQIKSAASSPIDVISAPGANKIICVVYWSLTKDSTAGAYSGGANWKLNYAGNATDVASQITLSMASASKQWGPNTGGFTSLTYSTFDPTNKKLQLKSSGDITGGNAANSLKYTIAYYIMNAN